MTTNKPEVKRYDCTSGGRSHCYGCCTMTETEDGEYVSAEDFEALQAECEELRKDAEFGRSVLSKREPGKVYGCHCDLEEGMEPDGCVIDSGERHNCIHAKDIPVKDQCSHWAVIATDAAIQEYNPCLT